MGVSISGDILVFPIDVGEVEIATKPKDWILKLIMYIVNFGRKFVTKFKIEVRGPVDRAYDQGSGVFYVYFTKNWFGVLGWGNFLAAEVFFNGYQDPPSSSGAVPAEYVIVPEEEFIVFVSILLILLGTNEPCFGAYDNVRFGITR